MATDGLTGFVNDNEIRQTIIEFKEEDIDEISAKLINMANDVSGKDNVSVILIRV